jgi:hypothetical protein
MHIPVNINTRPEQLKQVMALSPIKAADLALCLEVSKSALSRTFAGVNRSLSPERIRQIAGLLHLEVTDDGYAGLADRLYVWAVTTQAKREALSPAIETWLGRNEDLVSHPVLPAVTTESKGWTFLLIKPKKQRLHRRNVAGSASVLLAIRDEALERLPARVDCLPAMQTPVFQIDSEKFEEGIRREAKPGSAHSYDGESDLDGALAGMVVNTWDGEALFNYLHRCRIGLGIDTSAVEANAKISAGKVRRARIFPDHMDDADASPSPDETEVQSEQPFRDRLDRSRTGKGAWQILAYAPGAYPGPWCPCGAIAIDADLLPHRLHTAANSEMLRIIRYPDTSAYFVTLPTKPWPLSVAKNAGEGSYLIESVMHGEGCCRYEIAMVRPEGEHFIVWPTGGEPLKMHYTDEIYATPDYTGSWRFRIIGQTVGRLSFFMP